MAGGIIIASDLGSQSVKTALYDEERNCLAVSHRDARIVKAGSGALVYDGDDFYRLVVENIRQVVHEARVSARNVAALSFTGMGGGIVGIDDSWRPTMEYTNPLDCRDQVLFKEPMERLAERIRRLSGTGCPMGANKIFWIKEAKPEVYRRTRKFMLVTQYVQGRLAALPYRQAFWEHTSTPLSGLADAARYAWSEELGDALGIDLEKLPRIVEPTEVVGTLSRTAAGECSLAEGVPIVAGAYDKPCDQLGSGSNEVGSIVDNAATYPALTVCVDRFDPDMRCKTLECSPSAVKGLWIAMTYIAGGGLTHRWFCDNFCRLEKKDGRAEAGLFETLDAQAARVPPGSNGLLFVPHLTGRATPSDPEVRGTWIGFTLTHGRDHFYRSILESIAYDQAASLRIVRDLYAHVRFEGVRILGGGAVSPLWNQIRADVIGLPYIRLKRSDCTVLGAAIIGGKAVGLFRGDMQGIARESQAVKETYLPRPEYHDFYRHYAAMYDRLLRDLKPVYAGLAETARIQAPVEENGAGGGLRNP